MERIENILDKFQSVLFSESGASGLGAYVSYLVQYSYILAAILMIIFVGTKIAAYFANPTKEIDPYILVKPILILMILALYQPLINLLLFKPTDIIIDITEDAAIHVTDANNKEEFSTLFYNAITNVPQSGNEEDPDFSFYDILAFSYVFEILHFLIYIIAATVTAYITVRQFLLKAFYFVLGVLVLPLSLIPGNDEILKKWFFGFLSVLLWIPVLRVVQTIMIILHTVDTNSDGGSIVEVMFPVVLQIVMIFFILSVPKYANLLVSGSGDSDSNGWLVFIGREIYYKRTGMGVGKSALANRLKGK
jgi:hypothetical protein